MRKLPHWCLTDKFPGFYDIESGTAIEQTAKVYKAMQELIEEYNLWVDKTNALIEAFMTGAANDYEVFKVALRQEFQDFIDVVNLKIKGQDAVIANAVDYMKNNLRATIRDMIAGLRETGELNEDILACFQDFADQIAAEKTAREEADSALDNKITAEQAARTEKDTELEQAIAAERESRQNADSALDDKITGEQTAREQAITAEQTARAQAITAEQTAREQAITAEQTARENADTALSERITGEQTAREQAITAEQTARTEAITAEQTARQNADVELERKIETAKSQNDAANSCYFNTRPKCTWGSGDITRVYRTFFSMNGFRVGGSYLKPGTKMYRLKQELIERGLGLADIANTRVCTVKPRCSWVALFAVKPKNSDYCEFRFSPFMRVNTVNGNTISVLKTTENTYGATWDIGLSDDISGCDILFCTLEGTISAEVRKVIAKETDSSFKVDSTFRVAGGDNVLIAPALDGEEYVYIASLYMDTNEFRNRQDDGFNVYSYGVGTNDEMTIDGNNRNFWTDFKYTISPLALSVYYKVCVVSRNTATGWMYVNHGEDSYHLIPAVGIEKVVATSQDFYTPMLHCACGYQNKYAINVNEKISSDPTTDVQLRAWGFTE